MYKNFDSFMLSQEYTKTNVDWCVYMKQFLDEKFIILLLYVDDMLIMGHDIKIIDDLKKNSLKSFDIKDLDLAR